MSDLVPIGRFSQITRLTLKALRIYDEQGILPPAEVDPVSGYHYYSLTQAAAAARIRLLRSVEMPLEEIRQLLQAQDSEIARVLLERHRRRVEGRIAEYQRSLVLLQKLLNGEEVMPYEVKIREAPEQPILYIRACTSIGEMDGTIPQAFAELHRYLERKRRSAAGPDFCVYPYPEVSRDDFVADACVSVEQTLEGEGRITAGELPGGPIAYTVHTGPYDELHQAFQAVLGWIREHGHEITGPLREIYLVHPDNADDPAQHRTEVGWPVR